MQPPPLSGSTVSGLDPCTTNLKPFREGNHKPEKHQAIFVENEDLKLTYLPALGGRIRSLVRKALFEGNVVHSEIQQLAQPAARAAAHDEEALQSGMEGVPKERIVPVGKEQARSSYYLQAARCKPA